MASAKSSRSRVITLQRRATTLRTSGNTLEENLNVFKSDNFDVDGFVQSKCNSLNEKVELVKCIVQNIVVDISFNQLGGLCTLCFLERVDGLIGKDHLFKRSIILIKAWCYYESRILNAHHGLISTYAMETSVLYIFHSTLNGPLAVLYRFLDYFSKFDWDNYCISLTGPVRKSSLPEIVDEQHFLTLSKRPVSLFLWSDAAGRCWCSLAAGVAG